MGRWVKGCGALTGLLALAACGGDEQVMPEEPQTAEDAERIECALGGAEAYAKDCVVERAMMDGVEGIVVTHPDGGFRRFTLRPEGGGLVEVDGADEAVQRLSDGRLEVEVVGDRYRFPARPAKLEGQAEEADSIEPSAEPIADDAVPSEAADASAQ